MDNATLEKMLIDSLADFKLDQDEKYQFKQLTESLSTDKLNFVRNKAFDLTQPYIKLGGDEAVKVINWLERVVKAIQPMAPSVFIESSACFSPGNDCRNKIISLLKRAKQQIRICVFTISDNKITDAILQAHERGIDVTIISDNDKANDRGSDVDYLSGKGIKVLFDDSPYHMHHKFALFDQKILLNGSFNWTRSATDVNEENIIVTGDKQLVATFNRQFDNLIQKFEVN